MKVFIFEVVVMVFLIYFVVLVLSIKGEKWNNIISPYECGFDPLIGSRLSFSYRFFLISILFLIFDVEISLLFPIPYEFFSKFIEVGVVIFLFVLIIGLLYEYWNGILAWL